MKNGPLSQRLIGGWSVVVRKVFGPYRSRMPQFDVALLHDDGARIPPGPNRFNDRFSAELESYRLASVVESPW